MQAPDAPRATLSACIIARDEEERLPGCLASVAFCDEIVVVDSGSRDGTIAVARAAGARVVEHPWRGYGAQRNVALDAARGDWVLEIDADERVSEALRDEIRAFVAAADGAVALGGLPLREIFLGRALGPSAKYPKYRHRLLRRGAYRHDEARTVHEGLVPHGEVVAFTGDLVHLIAGSWREAIADASRYARLEAGQLDAPRTARAFVAGAVLRPAAKLVFRVVADGGWRDGWRGVLRISLDCGGDAAVWLRHLSRRSGPVRGRSGVAPGLHFGAWRTRLGSPRLAVVADHGSAARASGWARRAVAAGADVVLVADAAADGVRVRAVPRLGPLHTLRALQAEEQLRPLDAVVAFGRAARTATRILPGTLRDACRVDGDRTDVDEALASALAGRPL